MGGPAEAGRGAALTTKKPDPTISDAPTAGACPRCGVVKPVGGPCTGCGFDPSAGAGAAPLGPTGATFPGFRVLREVKAGGMGEVLQAHPDRHPSDLRAIKVIRPELVGSARMEQLFQDEVVAVQRIVHPGVVRVFHLGHATDDRLFVVMEWLPGRSLADAMLDAATPFGDPTHPDLPAAATQLVRQLGAALDAAHAEQVLHRDIKPSNVMLVREPTEGEGVSGKTLQAKLIDFGIARLGTEARTGASASVALGTVEHMAPEVARGEKTTTRTDVYLLAQLMYRVLTGLRRTTGAPRPPSRVNPRFSRDVDDLFADALADEPKWRPETTGALADQLAVLLDGITEVEAAALRREQTEAETAREARDQARQDDEEKARHKARESKRRRAQEMARKEKLEAARREAGERARREAEALTRRKAEEEARRRAEMHRRAAEQSTVGDAGRPKASLKTPFGRLVLVFALAIAGLVGIWLPDRQEGEELEPRGPSLTEAYATPTPRAAQAPTQTPRLSRTPTPAAAGRGESIFKTLCTACHTIGAGRLVGPDLRGVTDRHTTEWLVRWVQHSQKMVLEGDPAAVALFEEYRGIPMPDMPLTESKILDVLEYTKHAP